MTTTTVTPTLAVSWLKTHERLLIVLMVLLAGSWGFTRYTNADAAKTNARAEAAEQALTAQKATDAQNAAQILQLTQQYQQLTQVLTAQNASLAASLAQRQVVVVQKQAADAALALPALANRLQTLSGAPEGAVSISGDSVNITHPGVTAITQQLEEIAPLQDNLKDTTATLQAAEAAQAKGQQVIAEQATQISDLNLTITKEETACKAEVAAVKAEARKSKWHYFKLGVLTGFLGGLYAGHVGL